MEIFEKTLQSVNGGRILDVASGRGDFIGCIAEFQNIISIVAIDTNPEPVDFTKKFEHLPVTYVQCSAEKLPFADESFDTVCISNSLHHMSALHTVLAEMLRVLKKGGTYVINEMYSDTDDAQRLTHVLLHHWWGEIDTLIGIPHQKTYENRALDQLFHSLDIVEKQKIDYAFPKLEMDDDIRAQLLKSCDAYCEKVRVNKLSSDFLIRGELLKERINDVGFASAPSTLFVGKKV